MVGPCSSFKSDSEVFLAPDCEDRVSCLLDGEAKPFNLHISELDLTGVYQIKPGELVSQVAATLQIDLALLVEMNRWMVTDPNDDEVADAERCINGDVLSTAYSSVAYYRPPKLEVRNAWATRSQLDLPAGFQAGDPVFSQINYKKGAFNCRIGCRGVVLGACNNMTGSNWQMRLCCEFDDFKGFPINMLPSQLTHTLIEQPTIPGGFAVGDVVYSLIYHTSKEDQSIQPGCRGSVVGPCSHNASPNEARVCCNFENYEGWINMLVTQLSAELPAIPGGFAVGDVVYSRIYHTHCGQRFSPGCRGVVRGPGNNREAGDWEQRVCVEFDGRPSSSNMLHWELKAGGPAALPDGFAIGTTAYCRIGITKEDYCIKPGYKATVEGPCTNSMLQLASSSVNCRFEVFRDVFVNLDLPHTNLSLTPLALPPDFKIGSMVRLNGSRNYSSFDKTDSENSQKCAVCDQPAIVVCSKCKIVSYCGQECRKVAFREHSLLCLPAPLLEGEHLCVVIGPCSSSALPHYNSRVCCKVHGCDRPQNIIIHQLTPLGRYAVWGETVLRSSHLFPNRPTSLFLSAEVGDYTAAVETLPQIARKLGMNPVALLIANFGLTETSKLEPYDEKDHMDSPIDCLSDESLDDQCETVIRYPTSHHVCGHCSGVAKKQCSKCLRMHYCSAECQTKHFRVHKVDCKLWKRWARTIFAEQVPKVKAQVGALTDLAVAVEQDNTMPSAASVTPGMMSDYLSKLFKVSDSNDKCVVSQIEFVGLLFSSGFKFPENMIIALLKAAVVDENGMIEYERFVPDMIELIETGDANCRTPCGTKCSLHESLPRWHEAPAAELRRYLKKQLRYGDLTRQGLLHPRAFIELMICSTSPKEQQTVNLYPPQRYYFPAKLVLRLLLSMETDKKTNMVKYVEHMSAMLTAIAAHPREVLDDPMVDSASHCELTNLALTQLTQGPYTGQLQEESVVSQPVAKAHCGSTVDSSISEPQCESIVQPDKEPCTFKTLKSLGFSKAAILKAEIQTNNAGAEAALNWMLEHTEDAVLADFDWEKVKPAILRAVSKAKLKTELKRPREQQKKNSELEEVVPPEQDAEDGKKQSRVQGTAAAGEADCSDCGKTFPFEALKHWGVAAWIAQCIGENQMEHGLRCKDCQKKRPWAKIVLAQTQEIGAAASIEQQKQLLHEKLFCFIEKHPTVCATNWNGEVPIAAQITGMIVHLLEVPELISLYEAPDNLHAKVIEVVSMLVENCSLNSCIAFFRN